MTDPRAEQPETECGFCDHGTDPRTLTTCNHCDGTGIPGGNERARLRELDAREVGDDVGNMINDLLHKALGVDTCASACTHHLVHNWTALGVANVMGRKAEEEVERRGW